MKTLKAILFLSNEYSHPELASPGGIGVFVKTMAHRLAADGFKVIVLGMHPGKKTPLTDNGVRLEFVPCPGAYGLKVRKLLWDILSFGGKLKKVDAYFVRKNGLSYLRALRKLQKDNEIDVIESADFLGLHRCFSEVTIPLVVRCNGTATVLNEVFGSKQKFRKDKIAESMAFKVPQHTIAASRFIATTTQKLFRLEKEPKVIYNGIDADAFQFPQQQKIPNSIFYFGSLYKLKGCDRLCEIFSLVVEKVPGSTLHLIGRNSSYFEYLRNDVLSPNAVESTTYYGPVPNKDLPELISKAYLFVFPTYGEAFPLSILEAMSIGRPVLMSDIGVADELIEHGKDGFILGSNEEFLSCILELFRNEELAESIGKNARKKVLENFTVERMYEESLKYYRAVVGEKPKVDAAGGSLLSKGPNRI